MVALGATAAGAAARPAPAPLKTIGTFVGPLLADGERYYAVTRVSGDTLVGNARTGRSFVVRPPTGYVLAAIGGGEVLWTCETCDSWPGGQDAQRPLVMTIATRLFEPAVPGFDEYVRSLSPEEYLSFQRVGRNWLAGRVQGYHYQRPVFMNWRTGETADPAGPRSFEDLDRPGLKRRLCKPLRRRVQSSDSAYDDFADRYLPATLERPFALLEFYDAEQRTYRGELRRCGTRARTVLDLSGAQLGNGVVSGQRFDHPGNIGRLLAVAYIPRTRARWTWRLTGESNVTHAARRIFASTALGDNTWRVSSARIPRASKR